LAKSAKPSRSRRSDGEAPPRARRDPRAWLIRVFEARRPYGLLTVSAILMFLGFAGFGIWPLGLVGLLPALFVFDPTETRGGFDRPAGWGFFRRALFFGYVAYTGGFYWIEHTLETFSGFPPIVCWLFASVFWVFQGLQYVAMLALWVRARSRGFAATPALVAAYLATEAVFPMLFEHYYGASFHPVPVLMQVADLGGPMMCTAIVIGVNGALYEVLSATSKKERVPRLWPAVAAAYAVFAIVYGVARMSQTDARIADAPHLRIGVVQPSTGIGDNFENPVRNVRRHVEATEELEFTQEPDLVVWPESAVTYFIPRGLRDLDDWPMSRRLGLDVIDVPVLFGSLRQVRPSRDREEDRNTAFLVAGDGTILGTYDKTYLLAFGEYLPFGETFPVLYDLSPMSGRFTPGDDPSPLVLPHSVAGETPTEHRITTLVCYEDIVSSFVRRAVAVGDPHLLVNITNDSWFGDTHEPWVHMNLSRFRAIEHRRFLVRATNSGVSAVIDANGRVVSHTGTFVRATLVEDVAMLDGGGPTLYELVGAWPGIVALLAILAMGWLPPRFLPRRRAAANVSRNVTPPPASEGG
jgi:apolipoprotein N-acyltransferase